jgi:hypothetical protein
MPAATVTITPGYLPPDGTPITCAILRQIAQPTATANFQVPPATLNFLQNGNFNKTLWANLTGISATSVNTEQVTVTEPLYWTAIGTPTGAGKLFTVSPSTDAPNQQSYYSMEVDAASAGYTTLGIFTQLPSDVAAILEGQQVTFSFWIKNLQSGTFTPVANFLSPTTQDLFTGAMTNIATSSLQTVSQGTWTKMSGTVTLSNALVNNGLQVEIDLPTPSLTALVGGTVQFRFSQMFLQIGNVVTAFQSDPGLIEDVLTPQQSRVILGPQGTVASTMNGDMQIWQRNTSFLTVATATNVSDRYKLFHTMVTGRVTVSRQTVEFPAVANQYPHTAYSTRIAVTTAEASPGVGEYCILHQRIERQFARALFDGSTSLSLVLQSSVVGVFCVSIVSEAGTNSIVYECPVGVVNTPIRFTFPNIPAMPSTASGGNWGTNDTDFSYGVNVCVSAGSTFQAPALGAWQAGNYFASSNQTNLFAAGSPTLDITLIQHEAGSVCTPYSYQPFSQSILGCYRYYQKSYDYPLLFGAVSTAGFAIFTGVGTATAFGGDSFKTEMRVTPVLRICSPGAANISDALNESTGSDVGGGAIIAVSNSKRIYALSAVGVFVSGNIYGTHWDANSEM